MTSAPYAPLQLQLFVNGKAVSASGTVYNVELRTGYQQDITIVNDMGLRNWRLLIHHVVELDAGWYTARMMVLDHYGAPLARWRPFMFYTYPWVAPCACYWPGEPDGPVVLTIQHPSPYELEENPTS